MLDKNNKYMDDKLSGDYAFFKKKTNLVWGLWLRKEILFLLCVRASEKEPCLYYCAFGNQVHTHTVQGCIKYVSLSQVNMGLNPLELQPLMWEALVLLRSFEFPTPFQPLFASPQIGPLALAHYPALWKVPKLPGYHFPVSITLLTLIALVIREDSSSQNKRMEAQWSYHFLFQKGTWGQMFLELWDLPLSTLCHPSLLMVSWGAEQLRPVGLRACAFAWRWMVKNGGGKSQGWKGNRIPGIKWQCWRSRGGENK